MRSRRAGPIASGVQVSVAVIGWLRMTCAQTSHSPAGQTMGYRLRQRSCALRITVGRSLGRKACFSKTIRSSRVVSVGNVAVQTHRIRWKWVKVWRTSPAKACQSAAKGGESAGASDQTDPGQPSMPPSRPFVGAALQQQGSGPYALGDIDMAIPRGFGLFRCLARQVGLRSGGAGLTGVAQGADATGRRFRGADRGPQIHHRLRIISGSQVGRQRSGFFFQQGFEPGRGS